MSAGDSTDCDPHLIQHFKTPNVALGVGISSKRISLGSGSFAASGP
jgi:hypothetical protein